MAFINEFEENDSIYEQLLVANVTKGVSNSGLSYLSVTLQDKSGVIEGKLWSATPFDTETFVQGNIVRVSASVIMYKEKLQLKIMNGEKVDMSSVDISRFALASPVPQEELEAKLDAYIESISDPQYHLVVETIVKENREKMVVSPAAVRNHHEHMCGLLLHTTSMAKLADFIASCYPEVNRDLLLAGVILHDIGKVIELSGAVGTKYTVEGRLLGHISIMHAIVREKCLQLKIKEENRTLLEHMILSHHGEYEFGSPVLPLIREALLLNMIDDMDAKMNTLNKALSATKPGEFTTKLFALDDRCFYNPKKE